MDIVRSGAARRRYVLNLISLGGNLELPPLSYSLKSSLDNRAGVILSAIDFSKAFNRLDHYHCLQSFIKKGASTQILRFLGSFLCGRQMTIRINQERSSLRQVNAGAPQGSVLGCYLFNVEVDDLEEDFSFVGSETQMDVADETIGRTDDYPAVSTPLRVGPPIDVPVSPLCDPPEEMAIRFLPRIANIPPWIRKPKDPVFREGDLSTYKFVDDGVNSNPVNMRKAGLMSIDGEFYREIIDLRTQGLLEHIDARAANNGMAINAKKTSLMCVSASSTFDARVQIELAGQVVNGQENMKILGVTVDRDFSFATHVDNLARRSRQKSWPLSRLKKIGLGDKRLVRAYKCLIRPSVEYAVPAWHSLINAAQSEQLERQQTQALKNIFGQGLSAAKMRARAGLDTWCSRREKMTLKFAKKCLTNIRCQGWFEERPASRYMRRTSKNYPRYKEHTARTDRYRNSPKNYLRRKLNEQ